jgi:hypothetical protein
MKFLSLIAITPPLEEVRGKNKPGCDSRYVDRSHADSQLKNYNGRRGRYGYTIGEEKRRQYLKDAKGKIIGNLDVVYSEYSDFRRMHWKLDQTGNDS